MEHGTSAFCGDFWTNAEALKPFDCLIFCAITSITDFVPNELPEIDFDRLIDALRCIVSAHAVGDRSASPSGGLQYST